MITKRTYQCDRCKRVTEDGSTLTPVALPLKSVPGSSGRKDICDECTESLSKWWKQ